MVATFAPGIFPAAFRGHGGAAAVYFEAAASSPCWCCSARCSSCARARRPPARSARCSISRPRPRAACKDDGSDEEVSLDAVAVGDRLRVRPGDKVPVDGDVLEGHSSLDESMVTGESMPVTKDKDARVIGGTINLSGSFVMRADKVGRDTMLAQIVQMVASAQRSRAPIQRLADQVAGWFVPAVIAVALAGVRRLGDVRPGAALRLRAGRRGERADHRLPLRARACHADVDHGRRRPRRAGSAC